MTDLLSAYRTYADAWERAYETGDWAPLAPLFTEESSYEIIGGPPMDVAYHGLDHVLWGFADGIDRFDKRFDKRVARMVEGPWLEAGRTDSVCMRFETRYSLEGTPDVVLQGLERAVFRSGRIARLENLMDPGVADAVFQWYGMHVSKLPAVPSLTGRADEVPVVHVPSAGAERYWMPLIEQGDVTILLSPDNSASNQLSAGVHCLPGGGVLPPVSLRRSDLVLLLERGDATVVLDGEAQALAPGDTLAVGRGTPWQVTAGADGCRLFWLCAPGGYERALRAAGRRHKGEAAHPGDSDRLLSPDYYSGPASLGPLELARGTSKLVRVAERQSYWQSLPSTGWVDILISPFNHPTNSFAIGTQTLVPGAMIPPHAHRRNEELLYVLDGSGLGLTDHGVQPIAPGDAMYTGRFARHGVVATDQPLSLLWVFSPPELEVALAETGRPRTPGEPMPEPFPPAPEVLGVFEANNFAPL